MPHADNHGPSRFNGCVPYLYNNRCWFILNNKGGTDKKIMNRIFHQLEAMQSHYSRMFVSQFILFPPKATYDNRLISDYFKALIYRLQVEYGCQIGYIWVRERDKAEKQHYHCALYMNGHKVQHSGRVLDIARTLWTDLYQGGFPIPENNYYMAERFAKDNGQSMQAVITRLSYLAKNATKGMHSREVKRYNTSRIKPKVVAPFS